MRVLLPLTVLAALSLSTAAFAEDSGGSTPGASAADSAKALEMGVRVTAAVVAVPLRVAADGAGAVLKQTFVGLDDGSRADPFAGTALQVDKDVAVRPQAAPVVPRQVPAK